MSQQSWVVAEPDWRMLGCVRGKIPADLWEDPPVKQDERRSLCEVPSLQSGALKGTVTVSSLLPPLSLIWSHLEPIVT